jgi:hypothetical protein
VLLTEIPVLDGVLRAHAAELGDDFTGYRNHAYRVVNLGIALRAPDSGQLRQFAIAAAFHDLGIWTDRTFDYLGPSAGLACAHLAASGQAEWQTEVSGMITEHHRITRARAEPGLLAEPFRQADWIDVSHGIVTFGLSRKVLREIFAAWPDAGFHRRLVQLSLKRLWTNPGSPLPMLKW